MKASKLLVMMVLPLAAVAGTLGGCSQETRYSVLSFFFEGVPKPGEKSELKPVVRQARRPPPPVPTVTPTPTVEVFVVKEEHGRDWLAQLLPKLPKDKSGKPDMVRALNEKLIKPRPGISAKAKDQAPFNLNVEMVPKGQPAMKVVFSHKSHTQWLGCPNCHPAIFKMKKGDDPVTMATMYGGKYCGVCHGKVAFAVPTGCARCHAALGGGK
jgi:c(7)-type cytochrome triheme protein